MVASVGTLLHLDHLQCFQRLKAVLALDQQDYVTSPQLATFEVLLVVVEEVHT